MSDLTCPESPMQSEEDDIKVTEIKPKTTWIGAVFNKSDIATFAMWLGNRNTANTMIRDTEVPHMTIMYTPHVEGLNHEADYPKSCNGKDVVAKHIGWDVFTDSKLKGTKEERGGILVMLFDCPYVEERHNELMKLPGTKWDHKDGLRLHISVAEWCKPAYLDSIRLPIYTKPLRVIGEKIDTW